MADNNNTSTILPASFLVVALGVGGAFLSDSKLSSARHTENSITPTSIQISEETLEARLWQDPLEVVHQEWRSLQKEIIQNDKDAKKNEAVTTVYPQSHLLAIGEKQLSKDIVQVLKESRSSSSCDNKPNHKPSLLVMPIMVASGWYVDQRETRRRQRSALMAAFTAANYYPKDPKRIGYYMLNITGDNAAGKNNARSVFYEEHWDAEPSFQNWQPVAYEWLQPTLQSTCGGWHNILVLWVESGVLGSKPLSTLNTQLNELLNLQRSKQQHISIRVIGPAHSAQLVSMYKELKGTLKDAEKSLKEKEKRAKKLPFTPSIDNFTDEPIELTYELDVLIGLLTPLTTADTLLSSCFNGGLPTPDSTAPIAKLYPLQHGILKKCFKADDGDTKEYKLTLTEIIHLWISRNGFLPEGLREDLASTSVPISAITQSLLYSLNQYLDYGLPTKGVKPKALDNCIKNAKQQQGLMGFKSSLTQCLTTNITLIDDIESNTDWAEDSLDQWLSENEASVSNYIKLTSSNQSIKEQPLDSALFISARATMPWSFIATAKNDDAKFEQWLKKVYPKANYISALADDQNTLQLIVKELFQRRVINSDSDDPEIAVIFEQDSEYGRTMPFLLDCLISHSTSSENPVCEPPSKTNVFKHIKAYGYLSGIDGEKPIAYNRINKTQKAAIIDNKTSRKGERSPSQIAFSAGSHQLDYLQRLSRQMQKDKVKAVGVFGSDHYDKQLIIQALKKQMPNALLFTTDLDDRYSHASQNTWNKNLLIASSFGLSINQQFLNTPKKYGSKDVAISLFDKSTPAVQVSRNQTFDIDVNTFLSYRYPAAATPAPRNQAPDVNLPPFRDSNIPSSYGYPTKKVLRNQIPSGIASPPFRDSYQTAFYKAIRVAILSDDERKGVKAPPLPRLFEIGTSGAIDITVIKNKNKNKNKDAVLNAYQADDVGWQSAVPGTKAQIVGFLVLFSPILLVLALWGLRYLNLDASQQIEKKPLGYTCLGVLIATVILALGVSYYDDFSGEPKLFFSGISVLPSILIRLQIILIGIGIMFVAHGRFKQSDENLARRFNLGVAQASEKKTSFNINFYKALKLKHAFDAKAEKFNAVVLWQTFLRLSTPNNHWLRVLPLFFCLVIVLLFWYADSTGPTIIRFPSEYYYCAFTVFNFALIVLLCFTVALTIDGLRLAKAYIAVLGDNKVTWPLVFSGKDKVAGIDHQVWHIVRTVDMIADRTQAVMPLIFLPCMMIFLFLISRSSIFDAWPFSPDVIVIFLGLLALIVAFALLLQREAEKARARKLEILARKQAGLSNNARDVLISRQIEYAMAYIRNIKKGAFLPWHSHPIVQGLALPFGGVGSLALLEKFF